MSNRHQQLMWKRYDKHFRDVTPDFDLGDMRLDEIREKVRGGVLEPFRDVARRDSLGEAIDELSNDGE